MPNTTYGTPFVASSDLVSAYPGVSSTLATRIDQVSYAANGLNDQTGTAYTLVLTDAGKTVTLSNAGAVAVTIPANASAAIPTGSIVRFVNKGAGTVTIAPAGGVTLSGGNITLSQNGAVELVKLATDTWGPLTGSRGRIAQVVQAYKNDSFTTTSTSFVDLTGLSLSITPSSTTSTILLQASMGSVQQSGAASVLFNFVRGTTAIAQPSAGTALSSFQSQFGTTAGIGGALGLNFIDSPATTSATTYKIQVRVDGGTAFINRFPGSVNYTTVATLIAMEVVA